MLSVKITQNAEINPFENFWHLSPSSVRSTCSITKFSIKLVDIKINKINRKLKICKVKVRLRFESKKMWCDNFDAEYISPAAD